jgi:HAD superfamily hydrolase (TIGR01509 family)
MAAPGLVIFDCDGVLVDSEPLAMRVLLEIVASRGLVLDPATGYERFLGRSLASVCQDLEAAFGIDLDAPALEAMRQRLYATFEAELKPIPGVERVLAQLKTPFCVASSSQPERIALSLRVTGLLPHFEGRLFSASMVRHGKPAPDLFIHAAAATGCPPGATVVIEDSPVGITAARAAGMRVLGFLGGSHATGEAHRAALEALGPDAVVDDMRELPGLLATL